VLVEINGQKVSARFDEQIPKIYKMIADIPVGSEVKLIAFRNHKRKEFILMAADLEASVGKDEEIEKWGLTVCAITRPMAQKMKLPDTNGVHVTGVMPNKTAEKAGLKKGDIIMHIDKQSIKDLKTFKSLVSNAITSGKKNIILRVRRDKAVNFILIKND